MLLAVIVWICSLTVSQCLVTITINNEGNNSNNCCRRGACPCSNLTDALEHLDSNTIVNIISQQVTLDGHAVMSSRHPLLFLRDVRVLGNGATIMCNYKGSVGCAKCKNIIFEGITWDRCATTHRTQGMTFINAVDITISRCTFQYFNTCIGVVFSVSHGFIKIQQCQFLSNHVGRSVSECYMAYAALFIVSGDIIFAKRYDIKVNITETLFHDNGIFYDNHYGYSTVQIWLIQRATISVYMNNSTVSRSGGLGGNITLGNADEICITLNEVMFMYNDYGGSHISISNVLPVNKVMITSSNFTSNLGSALYLSNCNVELIGYVLFINNTAQSGSAIYFANNSQATIGNNSMLEFINNVAFLFGGAIYVDLPVYCNYQGITFTNLPHNLSVLFINNSAGIAGNSLYFSIPKKCNVIRNSSDSNSIVYIPYQFKYIHLPDSDVPEVATSPYAISLCSTECDTYNAANECFVGNGYMLGQSIHFNVSACDYYNVSELVQFIIECIDCNDNYRLSDRKILAHNGTSKIEFFAAHDSDVSMNTNVTINITSIVSHGYKQLSAVILVELSSCHSGYVFDTLLFYCKCYDEDQDVIRCQQGYAEIKYGNWFGTVAFEIRTFSLCPTYYCDFAEETETKDGFVNLPKEQNDQCSSHRTGMACGECISGYTLAYDSPDCINKNDCSPGITALVVILTILYWFVIMLTVFALMYFNVNVSIGYTYGLLFYYSIVDILLGSNLYISVGVFQLTTILSGFAKLTPQFLGKLCFVQGLNGIDQQFIHYVHALAVFLMTIIIVIIARRWPHRIATIVSHCIIRVICLLLLLAYTSLASTSLQLLRPLYYHDIDGAYVYLSPSVKYFTGRHVAYSIVALVCGLFIVIGFPLMLFIQPFLRGKVNFVKIKPLLDQFQGCYKDKYHWFAAYYLICRLVIIAMEFVNALYYLQTVCVIIVMIHIWIWPYKSDILNKLDGIILLTMILIVNLGSYIFIKSTTTALVITFVIYPLCSSLSVFFYFSFLSKWIDHIKNGIATARYVWYHNNNYAV